MVIIIWDAAGELVYRARLNDPSLASVLALLKLDQDHVVSVRERDCSTMLLLRVLDPGLVELNWYFHQGRPREVRRPHEVACRLMTAACGRPEEGRPQPIH